MRYAIDIFLNDKKKIHIYDPDDTNDTRGWDTAKQIGEDEALLLIACSDAEKCMTDIGGSGICCARLWEKQ